MADLMNPTDASLSSLSGIGAETGAKQKSPIERLHELQAEILAKDKEEYPAFQDGAMKKAQVAGKEALVSDFTYLSPGLFSNRPMVGRRVTILSGDHHVTVVYGCLKEMQNVVLPLLARCWIVSNSNRWEETNDAVPHVWKKQPYR